MQDEPSVRLVESARRLIEYYDKVFEILQRLENDSTSRIVWFVAIAGFALINVPLATTYRTPSLPLATILVPWLIVALLGAMTHWQVRNRRIADMRVYITRREFLMAYITNGPASATMAELNEILTNKKDPLPKQFKAQYSATRFSDWLELATMICFVISMGVTIHAYLPW